MNFDLKKPCDGCPFLKEGGVKFLGQGRAREIAEMMASPRGGTFPCHKTLAYGGGEEDEDYDGEGCETPGTQHCAGALLFMEKVNESGTNFIRVAERLGYYDKEAYKGSELVYDTVDEMVEGQRDDLEFIVRPKR